MKQSDALATIAELETKLAAETTARIAAEQRANGCSANFNQRHAVTEDLRTKLQLLEASAEAVPYTKAMGEKLGDNSEGFVVIAARHLGALIQEADPAKVESIALERIMGTRRAALGMARTLLQMHPYPSQPETTVYITRENLERYRTALHKAEAGMHRESRGCEYCHP